MCQRSAILFPFPGVRNLHVSTVVDLASGRLTMLYQIKEGACDQSFGIQVGVGALLLA